MKIVDTSFNCHNKMSYIKNMMHKYFLLEITTQICLTELEFPKFLSWTLPDRFSHYVYMHL